MGVNGKRSPLVRACKINEVESGAHSGPGFFCSTQSLNFYG